MKTLLAIRHVAFEDLGAFAAVFEDAGHAISYRDVGLHELSSIDPLLPDMLVVLGGPIGVYESDAYPFLGDEIELLRRRIAAKRPTLGICLGAQLIARALGAAVYPGRAKEIGFSPLSLSPAGRASPLRVFDGQPVLHWHGDTFDLPHGAVRLASTPACDNQAFSYGPNVLACQFHPEAEEKGFERWLIGHACEIAATKGVSVPALRAAMREQGAASAARGRACLTEWLSRLD